MANTIPSLTQQTYDHDMLLLASSILMDVNRLIASIQWIVAALLRCVLMSVSIADHLIEWAAPITGVEIRANH